MLCYICSSFFQICVLPIHHHSPVLLNVLQMICRCFKNSTVPRPWDKSIWLCCPSLPAVLSKQTSLNGLSQTSCTCARLHCSRGFHHPLEKMANLNLYRPTLCLSWVEGCNWKPPTGYKIITSNWLAYSSRFEREISLPSRGLVDPLENSEWTGAPPDCTSKLQPFGILVIALVTLILGTNNIHTSSRHQQSFAHIAE